MGNYAKTLHKIFTQHMFFLYLLESPQRGDSNKYPKHMFYEEIRIQEDLSYTLFCPLRILYNSKFIIMATFLGTNAVIVRRVYCNNIQLREWKHFKRRQLYQTVLVPSEIGVFS